MLKKTSQRLFRDTHETTDCLLGSNWFCFANIGCRYPVNFDTRILSTKSNTMFFSNVDVREDFVAYKHYVGPTRNRPTLSFNMVVDCYKGYMVFVHVGDEEHPKPIWLVKTLSSPNFVSAKLQFPSN